MPSAPTLPKFRKGYPKASSEEIAGAIDSLDSRDAKQMLKRFAAEADETLVKKLLHLATEHR